MSYFHQISGSNIFKSRDNNLIWYHSHKFMESIFITKHMVLCSYKLSGIMIYRFSSIYRIIKSFFHSSENIKKSNCSVYRLERGFIGTETNFFEFAMFKTYFDLVTHSESKGIIFTDFIYFWTVHFFHNLVYDRKKFGKRSFRAIVIIFEPFF